LPPFTPVTRRQDGPARLLGREARWIRDQVWTAGTVGDASAYLFPRGYDVDSGYGFLGTDYFSWMLDHHSAYYQYDLAHDDHLLDVPKDSSNDAAIERVMMAGGANSYDMACWSIAMSAAARNRFFSREEAAGFTDALIAYHHFLTTSFFPGGFQSYRAGGAGAWQYGESGQDAATGADAQGRPYDARNAYYWAYPSPRWQNPDPHWDPKAPAGARMNWPGWDAVTGEEAWVALLGPMQVAWNQSLGRPGWSAARAPVDALALVGNACRALRAVDLMQNSATGAIYRNVRPPASPDQPKWFDVSVENNWSMYTGLRFLKAALTDLRAALPGYRDVLDFDLDQSVLDLERIQAGMVRFFLDKALIWHATGQPFGDPAAVGHGFFLQGTGGRAGAAQGNTAAFATDVQTWGIAAILGDRDLERQLEPVYGKDFLYAMFRSAIELGGTFRPDPSGQPVLAGIGFNAQRPGDPASQMSGEWTWGAINAAIVLADFYREPGSADPAKAAELLAAARSMIAGVDELCSHDYNPQRLPGGRDWAGYLYANDRQWIPWGWFSNACPSQAATTWAMRVNAGFNSFELGGGEHQATVEQLGLAGGMAPGPGGEPGAGARTTGSCSRGPFAWARPMTCRGSS
jgi:hypothetical protein